jgi:hypothetical protein
LESQEQTLDNVAIKRHYLPSRVILHDPRLGSTTQALLKQVEINMPLVPEIFDFLATLKEQLHVHTARNALVHLKIP